MSTGRNIPIYNNAQEVQSVGGKICHFKKKLILVITEALTQVREYTKFSWIGFKLSTCITDTCSVFMEIVGFFHIFRKITVTNLWFWHLLRRQSTILWSNNTYFRKG